MDECDETFEEEVTGKFNIELYHLTEQLAFNPNNS